MSASLTPIRGTWIRVCGYEIRVHVREGRGDEHDVPLVLCNGIGASLEVFDSLIQGLDPERTVISFDVPGSGLSPVPRLPYTFHVLAATVARMLTQLGYVRFDVLGYSWGGALAQQLAFQFPRRCRRAVLMCTATGVMMVPAKPYVLWHMTTPRRYRDPEYAAQVAPLIYGGAARTDLEGVRAVFGKVETAASRRGYVYQLLAGSIWASLPFLPGIWQPVLILAGDDDPIIPLVNAKAMQRLIPHAQLSVFPGGHIDPLLRSDDIGSRIERFLTQKDNDNDE
ncbi:poly(3-hydroxyalkanoate) depolymerase [Hoyosella altamirensis]|uniref:Poly(3-hydroxyalkanoate) depolymerase n=1 Tax=Hoyosella altamirensis TaxID=616997 RepID=A0A839RHZ7_9ACTN|nr:poly(3-hydroxyalkanoate) depolymerase [Hoyosella altamirensis]MBB3036255.1 poly(3-hydroxyalkanoate) depolymerase [Hoyosella altamirensis]